MRTFLRKILILFSFILGTINCYSQWDLIYLSDSIGNRDIHFFDSDTGFVIGVKNSNGRLLKTTNGGLSWDSTEFIGKYFWSMDFPSRDTGYIAFSNPFQVNVIRTIDGGNTWQQTTNNLLVGNTKMDIKFYDNEVGVLSMGGFSWKTIDAGINWSLIANNPMGGGQEIFIEDSVLVGGGGSSIMYFTFDTSATYDSVIFCNNSTSSSFYLKDGSINICGRGQDGGSWGYGHINYGIIVLSDILNMQFTTIHFPFPQMYTITDIVKTNNFYYAVGYPFNSTVGSHFLKSSDGINWFRQESSEPGGVQIALIERVFCLNDTLCYAYGGGRIYKTTNGGGAMLQQTGVLINGVDEMPSANNFQIYPNPNSGYFQLELESSFNISDEIELYNLIGEKVYSQNVFIQSGQNNFEINISHLPSGVFIIKMKNQPVYHKVFIQN